VDVLGEVASAFIGAAAAQGRRRRLSRPSFRRPFLRIVDTPWPRVAAVGVGVLVAGAGALLVAVAGSLVASMADDTLGLGMLLLFGPVLLAGLGAVVPVIGGLMGVANRAWSMDGNARLELGLVAIAALMLLALPYLATLWWPLLLPGLAAAGVLAIAIWPAPWREVPTIPLLYSE
jgi:hypothetical protein